MKDRGIKNRVRKNILTAILVLLLVILLSNSDYLLFPTSRGDVAKMSPYQEIDDYLKKIRFSGVVLIDKKGENFLNKAYGYADRFKLTPNTLQTKFAVNSINKHFTVIAILSLQEQRKLKIEDRVCKYITNCPTGWQEITIHHLLTSSSGLADYFIPCFTNREKAQEIITKAQKEWLLFEPGRMFSYSSIGYRVLGEIIEKVSGKTYETFLKENIFQPFELDDSGFVSSESGSLARGYYNFLLPACEVDLSLGKGGGGGYYTSRDLYLWRLALGNQKFVKPAKLDEIFKPLIKTNKSADFDAFGYGWAIGEKNGHQIFFDSSFIQGCSSFIAILPDQRDKYTLIVLSNQQNYRTGSVSNYIIKKLLQ